MNHSQFMDKQIMDLSSSSSPTSRNNSDKVFIDLMNSSPNEDLQRQRGGVIGGRDSEFESKKEETMPSYDFQPIRPSVGLSLSTSNIIGSANNTARVWSSSDSRPISTSPIRNYGSLDSLEPATFVLEKDRNVPNTTMLSEIDRTMKKHVVDLLHVLDGVSDRLMQLETRTRNLENLVDDLKISVGNSHGSSDGKMRHLENILREVQTGVQVLKDKQEIAEAQLQLSMLQASKADPQSETQNSTHIDSTTQPPPAPQPHHHQLPPVSFPQPPAASIAPPCLPQQSLPAPLQPPTQHPSTQFSPSHPEAYFPTPAQGQTQPPYQALPLPTQPQHQPPNQPPLPQAPQYSQPPQPPQPTPSYHPEDPPYAPQTFPPNPPHQLPYQPPPASSAASQQYYNGPPSLYEPSSARPNSGFPSGYASQTGSSEPFPYGGSVSSQFLSTHGMKLPHLSGGGGTGYPQLPTARPLPHALPMASAVSSGGSGSPRSENRVPIDDVVDQVMSMGFPREQVGVTVRRLTESGQAVDLNVVLDKLMNDGGVPQSPQRGWFGGR